MSRIVIVSARVPACEAAARYAAPRLLPKRTAGGAGAAGAAGASRRALKQPTTRCSANADDDTVKLEPRHPMRLFIKKTGAKPVDEDDAPIRYESDTTVYAFESVEVSRERRRWLSQTPFLTAQLGGEHDVRVVMFVADASVRPDGLCKEAEKLLSGIDYTMVTVYAEELYYIVHRLDADVMVVSEKDVRLARLGTSRDD